MNMWKRYLVEIGYGAVITTRLEGVGIACVYPSLVYLIVGAAAGGGL